MSELRVGTLLPAAVAGHLRIDKKDVRQPETFLFLPGQNSIMVATFPATVMFWSVVGWYVPWFQSVWLALALIHILVYTEDLGNVLMFLFFFLQFYSQDEHLHYLQY